MNKISWVLIVFIVLGVGFFIFMLFDINRISVANHKESQKTYTVTVEFKNVKGYEYHPYKGLILINSRDKLYKDTTTMKLIQFNCPFIAEQD